MRFVGFDGDLGTDQLDGVGPIQQPMLGQIHLAHAPGRQSALDPVLPEMPRFGGLPLQRGELVGPKDGNGDGRGHHPRHGKQLKQRRGGPVRLGGNENQVAA